MLPELILIRHPAQLKGSEAQPTTQAFGGVNKSAMPPTLPILPSHAHFHDRPLNNQLRILTLAINLLS